MNVGSSHVEMLISFVEFFIYMWDKVNHLLKCPVKMCDSHMKKQI